MYETRVLSGMRPTGALHLGHFHGVLKNWIRLQAEYPCLFFVADWHALTTDYEKPGDLQQTGLAPQPLRVLLRVRAQLRGRLLRGRQEDDRHRSPPGDLLSGGDAAKRENEQHQQSNSR